MAAFDQAAGLVQDHVRDLDVALRRLVEGRGDDFGLDAALHVGDFFRTLVDQEDDLVHFGMVLGDGVGDGLE